MNLYQVLSSLADFDDEETIYAKEPWSLASEAIVAVEPEDGSLPGDAQTKGLSYFVEIFVAKEFLEAGLKTWTTSLLLPRRRNG